MGYCYGDLPQWKSLNLTENDYLVHQVRMFLEQGNYEQEQLQNMSALMDKICQSEDGENNYAISTHLDLNKYNGTSGKVNRCRAIDDVMEAMYPLFKKASLNKSEPLDFASIQLFETDKTKSYPVVDLINTIWIKAEVPLDVICSITNPIKVYSTTRVTNSTAQDRSSHQTKGVFNTVLDMIDRLLDPILGLQKRLFWESNTRYEQVYSGLAYQLNNLRDGFGKRYSNTKKTLSGLLGMSTNSTMNANSTVTGVNNTNSRIPNPLNVNQTVYNSTSWLQQQQPRSVAVNQTSTSTTPSMKWATNIEHT